MNEVSNQSVLDSQDQNIALTIEIPKNDHKEHDLPLKSYRSKNVQI